MVIGTVVTMVTTDGRKAILKEARIPGYSSALRGGANLGNLLLHRAGMWGAGGEKRARTSMGHPLCARHIRRQRCSSS